MKQVGKEHYNFSRYSHPERWASYFYQLREVLALKPQNVLEVGVGDKVFGSYLMHNTNIHYTSLDVAEDLEPDIVGSVLSIPQDEAVYDVVCAFEVLEHLPFESFELALQEMRRVSRRYVVVSLPHFGPPVKFLLKVPLFPEWRLSFKIPYFRRHRYNGQHYWEIGKRRYSARRIRTTLEKHFILHKEFIPFENQYHHFFVLEKREATR
jgi:ubiquinone/menaquinone biosynthesis C-methylase UbiE